MRDRRFMPAFVFVVVVIPGELNSDVSWGQAVTLGVCACALVAVVVARVARR